VKLLFFTKFLIYKDCSFNENNINMVCTIGLGLRMKKNNMVNGIDKMGVLNFFEGII
jgi:hypothetical protein